MSANKIIIPTDKVTEWLKENHPEVEYEVERNWVWLLGDFWKNKEVRDSVKKYGFKYKKRGEHTLPSGATSKWAHHCDKPIAFRRHGGTEKKGSIGEEEVSNEELLAALGL